MSRRKKTVSPSDEQQKYDKQLVTTLSESNENERGKLLRWLADQAENTQVEIIKKRDELVRKRREQGKPVPPELSFSMLILATKIIQRDELALSLKARLEVAQAADVSRRRIDSFRRQRKAKSSPKYDRIKIQYYSLIADLLEKKFSWSEISLYLHKYHRFIVTRAYLQQTFSKIQKEGKPSATEKEEIHEAKQRY